ncbi:hypothetical protein [Selenomonas sp. AE3005]|uniref:hypothetical protein n=1 Tax=Selenomonas sp. AE3005 TaxID=1485543 RepID=UPI0025CCF759|nr:hypothetical protein [Selenomonas sp. AE3005]
MVKAVWPNSDQYDEVSYEFYIGQNVGIKKNGKQIYHTMRGRLIFLIKTQWRKTYVHFLKENMNKNGAMFLKEYGNIYFFREE